MHEFSLMADLLRKIEGIARQEEARQVTRVKVKLGALAHISPAHFREHFIEGTKGSVAEGAQLEVEACSDPEAAYAQDIVLESVEVAS